MTIKKLTSTDGFVRFDFDDAPSVGTVRSAKKILQGGAEWLARSITYSFASFGIEQGGASAGVNAVDDDRPGALAAFVEEITPLVASGSFRPNPGKGVAPAALAELRTADGRPDAALDEESVAELTAAGVAAGMERALGDLDGKRVAIEGFAADGVALARRLQGAGATIVAIGTPRAAAMNADGFTAEELAAAWDAHGDGLVGELGVEPTGSLKIFGAPCDALCVGSKAGALTHQGAAYVKAGAVVGTGPSPLTTKAFIVLREAGVQVIPEFLTIAGPLIVGAEGDESGDLTSLCDSIGARIGDAVAEAGEHPAGHLLGAAERAEAFLDTWRDERPFGRPLA